MTDDGHTVAHDETRGGRAVKKLNLTENQARALAERVVTAFEDAVVQAYKLGRFYVVRVKRGADRG